MYVHISKVCFDIALNQVIIYRLVTKLFRLSMVLNLTDGSNSRQKWHEHHCLHCDYYTYIYYCNKYRFCVVQNGSSINLQILCTLTTSRRNRIKYFLELTWYLLIYNNVIMIFKGVVNQLIPILALTEKVNLLSYICLTLFLKKNTNLHDVVKSSRYV